MKKTAKYAPEVRERSVRMVFEQPSAVSTRRNGRRIQSIAAKIGCSAQTLHSWIRQHERDFGQRDGVNSAETARIKELEREVRELKRANEILRLASAYFAQAELDRHNKCPTTSLTWTGTVSGASLSARPCRLPRRPTDAGWQAGATLICVARGLSATSV
jgi:transposase-like protein